MNKCNCEKPDYGYYYFGGKVYQTCIECYWKENPKHDGPFITKYGKKLLQSNMEKEGR